LFKIGVIAMPIIGISSFTQDKSLVTLNQAYINAIIAAGGTPVVLPNNPGLEEKYIHLCDGILLSGGGDVLARFYNVEKHETHEKSGDFSETRDEFEIGLVKVAKRDKKPTLGICRGMQVINVALGGDLVQHIDGHIQHDGRNVATHNITVTGARLAGLIGDKCKVNSFHHQAVRRLAPGISAEAYSDDGIVEAFEYVGNWFCLGVQWHPEAMLTSPEHLRQLNILLSFINACKERKFT